MHETVRIIRDVLLRTLLISFMITLIIFGIYFGGRSYWVSLIVGRLELIDQKSLDAIVIGFFALIRFYLIFILLAPTLALHWTFKRLKQS